MAVGGNDDVESSRLHKIRNDDDMSERDPRRIIV